MSRLFIDTNVILDILQERKPFLYDSLSVLQLGVDGVCVLFASSLTFANCYYVMRKIVSKEKTIEHLQTLKSFITIAPMDDEQCERALQSKTPDFEDMLQYESACAMNCDAIITRNQKHFPKDGIPIYSPFEYLQKP